MVAAMARSGQGQATPGLPAERSSFVGRRRELDELRQLVGQSRLVTLVGPGGVGKTRLAVRVAADLRRSFPDGTALADLAAVQDPVLVAGQVAAALDVRDVTGRWLLGGLAEVIDGRYVLLVLDNCEHLRDACAVLADALLAACPQLRVLATSRQPLDVEGEAVYLVPPLSAPGPDADGEAATYESVQLLMVRARAAAPTLSLMPGDYAAMGELCRRLDGLPLAIELAAVRLRTLAPGELIARLGDRFRLLRRTGTAVVERHRTLRATLEWSYDLLNEREQLLWRRVSVFAGPFGLTAAERVCTDAALPTEDLLDVLSRLVETSVLDVSRRPDGSRFRLLESVRAFGRELLAKSGEESLVLARHRAWCGELASTAAAEFLGPRQVAAFDLLAASHAEISAALEHCLAIPGEQEAGLDMAADLWLYWQARGHLGEGRRWLEALLAAGPPGGPVHARGLAVTGFLALSTFDPASAVPLLEEAQEMATDTGQATLEAFTTQCLGQAALFQGDLRRADALLRAAADRYLELDRGSSAFPLADVGITAWLAGSYAEAAAALEESLVRNEGGDPWTRSHALWGLGLVRLRSGDHEEATVLEREALRLMRQVEDRSGVALGVEALAWAAAAQEEWERAARLAGAAQAVWRSIPTDVPAPLAPYRAEYVAAARRALGDQRWSALHGEGSALQRVEAVALALAEPRRRPRAQPPDATERAGGRLTPRQQEVAALVADGLTDRQIAARLVVSPRTAEYHVEQILTRLGFRSRTEIAAWAATRRAGQTAGRVHSSGTLAESGILMDSDAPSPERVDAPTPRTFVQSPDNRPSVSNRDPDRR
jgi:non-specific serine/threonine protein kinase